MGILIMKDEQEVHWKELGIKMVLIVTMAIIIHFVMTGALG